MALSASAPMVRYARYIASIGGFQPEINLIWPLSGRIHYCPIEIPFKLSIDRFGCLHATVGAGNFYLALYNSLNEAPNSRLAVSADTGAAGVSQKELVAMSGLTSLQLNAGLYFLALTVNNNTDRYWTNTLSYNILNPSNINNGPSWYYEDQAYNVPPSTPTPIQDGNERPNLLFVRVLSIP